MFWITKHLYRVSFTTMKQNLSDQNNEVDGKEFKKKTRAKHVAKATTGVPFEE